MEYELEYRDEGTDVRRLQEYLLSEHGASLSPDGLFGPNTRDALIQFQRKQGLNLSGKVDEATCNALEDHGLVLLGKPLADAGMALNWPSVPPHLPQPTAALTASLFGEFEFRHTPTASNPEQIEILNGWERDNIVEIRIPQLDKCLFAAGRHHVRREVGTIRCHRKAAPIFVELFERWNDAGLMDRVLTCAGAFNARLKRGATSAKRINLSNHSWGTAIDLNAVENGLGRIPVGVGARGALRELVKIANDLQVFWGGHFANRPDGMHFEVASLPRR